MSFIEENTNTQQAQQRFSQSASYCKMYWRIEGANVLDMTLRVGGSGIQVALTSEMQLASPSFQSPMFLRQHPFGNENNASAVLGPQFAVVNVIHPGAIDASTEYLDIAPVFNVGFDTMQYSQGFVQPIRALMNRVCIMTIIDGPVFPQFGMLTAVSNLGGTEVYGPGLLNQNLDRMNSSSIFPFENVYDLLPPQFQQQGEQEFPIAIKVCALPFRMARNSPPWMQPYRGTLKLAVSDLDRCDLQNPLGAAFIPFGQQVSFNGQPSNNTFHGQ